MHTVPLRFTIRPYVVATLVGLLTLWSVGSSAQTATASDSTRYQDYEVERKPTLQNFAELSSAVQLPEGIANRVLDIRITFRVLVDNRGNYQDHELLSEEEPALAAACEAVLEKAVFQPAVRLNKLVWCWTIVSFRFSFDGSGSTLREPIPENLTYVRQKIGYPEIAKRSGIMGLVVVRVEVNEKGRVSDYELLHAPHKLLTEPVVASLTDLRFLPGAVDGTPTKRWVEVPFSFQLVGLYKQWEFKPNVRYDPREARKARKREKRLSRGKSYIEKEPTARQLRKQAKRQRKLEKKQAKREKRGRISLPPVTEKPNVTTPPQLLNPKRLQRKIDYPKIAALAGRDGRVIVAVYVLPTKKDKAKVIAAQVVACPEADLTVEALKAVKKAKFSAARKDNKPVGTWAHVIVDFKAEGKSLINADTKRVLLIFKKRIRPTLTINVHSELRAEPYN